MLQTVFNILFMGFIFSGCINNANKSSTIPNWYLSSPQNNLNFIYGVGEGKNIDEAKQNALNDISSRLIVSVSSVVNAQIKINNNGKYSKNRTCTNCSRESSIPLQIVNGIKNINAQLAEILP